MQVICFEWKKCDGQGHFQGQGHTKGHEFFLAYTKFGDLDFMLRLTHSDCVFSFVFELQTINDTYFRLSWFVDR